MDVKPGTENQAFPAIRSDIKYVKGFQIGDLAKMEKNELIDAIDEAIYFMTYPYRGETPETSGYDPDGGWVKIAILDDEYHRVYNEVALRYIFFLLKKFI